MRDGAGGPNCPQVYLCKRKGGAGVLTQNGRCVLERPRGHRAEVGGMRPRAQRRWAPGSWEGQEGPSLGPPGEPLLHRGFCFSVFNFYTDNKNVSTDINVNKTK